METYNYMREYFATGVTADLAWRRNMLKQLKTALTAHEDDIIEALQKDFGKPAFETYTNEMMIVIQEIDYQLRHLTRLAAPKHAGTGIFNLGASGRIYAEPYGLVLIMSPWNYPLLLALQPLVGAIAAGNLVVLKPSNYASHTAETLKDIISEVFVPKQVTVVLGGREANSDLLDQRFDMIFFTGSPQVGRIVMEKAAKQVTPVVLELGGKSPCIVDEGYDIDRAARRIVWGKFLNAGQTCIAPDYILIREEAAEAFIKACAHYIHQYYYQKSEIPEDLCRIINDKHYQRLISLIDQKKVAIGGKTDPQRRLIEPTIIDKVSYDDPIMQEEIFGPLMPIIHYHSLDAVIERLKHQEKPLALYFFSNDKHHIDQVVRSTSSGGCCINDVIMHISSHDLPFGGVGNSGMGVYHGAKSFAAFTHYKSVLFQTNAFDMSFRYPPYEHKRRLARWLAVKKNR